MKQSDSTVPALLEEGENENRVVLFCGRRTKAKMYVQFFLNSKETHKELILFQLKITTHTPNAAMSISKVGKSHTTNFPSRLEVEIV